MSRKLADDLIQVMQLIAFCRRNVRNTKVYDAKKLWFVVVQRL